MADQLDQLKRCPHPPWLLSLTAGSTDETYQNEFTETTMPAKDLTLYAKWEPDDINYFLVLRKEGADGKWSQTTETRTGETDETVTINPAEFLTEAENDTYDIPESVSYTVSAEDGGTVSISYARKRYSLTYDLNAADAHGFRPPVLNPIVWALRSSS